jgi:hypothetical protein
MEWGFNVEEGDLIEKRSVALKAGLLLDYDLRPIRSVALKHEVLIPYNCRPITVHHIMVKGRVEMSSKLKHPEFDSALKNCLNYVGG